MFTFKLTTLKETGMSEHAHHVCTCECRVGDVCVLYYKEIVIANF